MTKTSFRHLKIGDQIQGPHREIWTVSPTWNGELPILIQKGKPGKERFRIIDASMLDQFRPLRERHEVKP